MDPRSDETRQIEHVRDDLLREFAALPRQVVEGEVAAVASTFTAAPVRSFVPVLVRRTARDRLRQLVPH